MTIKIGVPSKGRLRKNVLDVFGPIQADAALSQSISKTKGLENGGNANVLIFPSKFLYN